MSCDMELEPPQERHTCSVCGCDLSEAVVGFGGPGVVVDKCEWCSED
jgi:hypothetical protein